MTEQEIFEATALNSTIEYQGKRWVIQSTFNDGTADLKRKNDMGDLEMTNAPFTQMKLAKGGRKQCWRITCYAIAVAKSLLLRMNGFTAILKDTSITFAVIVVLEIGLETTKKKSISMFYMGLDYSSLKSRKERGKHEIQRIQQKNSIAR